MKQFLILAFSIALLATAADGNSIAAQAHEVKHDQNDLSLLGTAIRKQTIANVKVAFSLHYDSDFVNAHSVVRYDPRNKEHNWTVVESPGLELSDEDRRSMIEAVSSVEAQNVFGDFDPDFFASIDSPVEVIEHEDEISHDFRLPAGQLINRGEKLDAGDAIRMTITVNRRTGLITRMRTYAVKPFKLNKVAKVKKFEQDLHFMALPGADVSVVIQRRDDILIRAFLFRKMVEDWQYSYSDYEIVE